MKGRKMETESVSMLSPLILDRMKQPEILFRFSRTGIQEEDSRKGSSTENRARINRNRLSGDSLQNVQQGNKKSGRRPITGSID